MRQSPSKSIQQTSFISESECTTTLKLKQGTKKVQDCTESGGNENAVANTSKCCQYKTSWIINHLHKTTDVRTAKRILQH